MSEPKRAKILVVDDEQTIRDYLQHVLTDQGYAVLTAPDGEAALPLAFSEQPDLILLDIMMPRLDGMETCRRLRAHPATQRTPVLILTAHNTRDRLQESIAAGADDFLGKPVDAAELRLRIRAMLKVKDRIDEVARLKSRVKELNASRLKTEPSKISKD
jgi:two-component system cell cycle response regulator